MADLTVIILTYNEAIHIRRCIESVKDIARRIIVVDSFSTDATPQLALDAGAEVVQHEFRNQSQQLNWALDEIDIDTAWTLRLDADEYVLPETAAEIERRLPMLPDDISGVALNRRVIFMGRWIRHGGVYPTVLLRIWRTGRGRAEDLPMDEHIVIDDGGIIHFQHDIVDENLRDLTWWTDKHNAYATREARHLVNRSLTPGQHGLESHTKRRRWQKDNLYLRLPIGLRSWGYFLYRFVIRLGFLDGRPGLIFHTLQGLWYRFLVDAKIYESTIRLQSDRRSRLDGSAAVSEPDQQ